MVVRFPIEEDGTKQPFVCPTHEYKPDTEPEDKYENADVFSALTMTLLNRLNASARTSRRYFSWYANARARRESTFVK